MTPDLPETWDEEPWPLDDPAPASFRPANWSDTHDNPPQVADLADEAWEYAMDHGVSMEVALARLQRREMAWSATNFTGQIQTIHIDPSPVVDVFQRAADQIAQVFQYVDIDRLREQVEALADDMNGLADGPSKKPQPSCPKHGLLAKGGFCRRCAARGHR